ncbi:MAG: transferrin-binding protein-like solute binding protein [Rhodobacterales bacterium]
MYTKSILSIVAIATLSACGGSSTGPSSFTTAGTPPPAASNQAAFDERVSRGLALVDKYEDASVTAVMPTSGSASYSGLAGFSDVRNFDVEDVLATADVSMTANFTAGGGTVSGDISNFLAINEDNTQIEAYSGSLQISGGTIIGSNLVANVGGTLVDPEGAFSVTGNMQGEFLGAGAEALRAEMELLDTEDNEQFYGLLIAERN